MNPTDIMLLAVIGLSALLGVMRGLVGVLASLGGWVLGTWAAFAFGDDAAVLLAKNEPGAGELLAGYGLCFVGVMIGVGLLAYVVRTAIRSVGLSGVDRALGLAFGSVRGALIGAVLILLMGFTGMPRDGAWNGSILVPVLLPVARWMRGWLPEWAAARADLAAYTAKIDTLQLLSQYDLPADASASAKPKRA